MNSASGFSWQASSAEKGRDFETTLSVISGLFRYIDEIDFAVRLWDGELLLPENVEPRFTLVLTHPGALRPGGLFLNHAIATHRLKPDSWAARTFLQSGQFLQRYVFPDGELVPISQMLAPAEAQGFEVRDVESLREHYALTLRKWVGNLESNHDRCLELNDERTYRTWRLYMAASVHGFESGRTNVYQSLLSKGDAGASELPLTRQDLYRDSGVKSAGRFTDLANRQEGQT